MMKVYGLLSATLTIHMEGSGPDLWVTRRSRSQLVVAGDLQQNGAKLGRGLLAEDLFDPILRTAPGVFGALQQSFPLLGERHVPLAAVVSRLPQFQELVAFQRTQIVAERGSVHDHGGGELADGNGPGGGPVLDLGQYGVLRGLETDGSKSRIVELGYAPRCLSKTSTSADGL
jgi:hypothetical protein